ncbi:MAG: SPOR domain-containing protein [Zoogloeaceae bacterium]|jgi:cell division protein FtsN|nr:SPOR domain-containing protein [Zoogloeaceae bacterium]
MTKETRRNTKAPPKKKSSGGTLVGLFLGLVLGVVVSAAVVWYVNGMPKPFMNKLTNAPDPALLPGEAPAVLPGKPGDSRASAGRSAGYPDIPNASAAAASGNGVVSQPLPPQNQSLPQVETRRYLQAGAFSRAEDADKQKAVLAMSGLEAEVQQVTVRNRTFYRLILGPYDKLEAAQQDRQTLSAMGIESTLSNRE